MVNAFTAGAMGTISSWRQNRRDAHGLAAPEYSGDLCLQRTDGSRKTKLSDKIIKAGSG